MLPLDIEKLRLFSSSVWYIGPHFTNIRKNRNVDLIHIPPYGNHSVVVIVHVPVVEPEMHPLVLRMAIPISGRADFELGCMQNFYHV